MTDSPRANLAVAVLVEEIDDLPIWPENTSENALCPQKAWGARRLV
jgi:hypothetical protein